MQRYQLVSDKVSDLVAGCIYNFSCTDLKSLLCMCNNTPLLIVDVFDACVPVNPQAFADPLLVKPMGKRIRIQARTLPGKNGIGSTKAERAPNVPGGQ